MDNSQKKKLITIISISILLIVLGILFFINQDSINNSLTSLFKSSNGKLGATITYECPTGTYETKTGTCVAYPVDDSSYDECGHNYNQSMGYYYYCYRDVKSWLQCKSFESKLGIKNDAGVFEDLTCAIKITSCSKGTYTDNCAWFNGRYRCGYCEGFKKVAHKTVEDISKATVSSIPDQTYTGNFIHPSFYVFYDGKKLTKDKDYTTFHLHNVDVGVASIEIDGIGDYKGKKTVYFNIVSKKETEQIKVSGIKEKYTYTGSAIKPDPTVTYGSKTLTKGTDYTITYENNINPGKAQIIVKGRGTYDGKSVYQSFMIVKSSSEVEPGSSQTPNYTGNKYKVTYIYTDVNSTCSPTGTYNKTTYENYATYGSSYYVEKNWWKCPGYDFVGWNEKSDGSRIVWNADVTWKKWGPYENDNYAHDVTLYAQWTPAKYTVKYHGNGGTYNGSETWTDPRPFYYNRVYLNNDGETPMIYVNDFERQGYKSAGWSTKKDGSQSTNWWPEGYMGDSTKKWLWKDGEYGIGNEKKQQLDLYAQWTPITYTIKFDANGGTGTAIGDMQKTYGIKTVAPANTFTKEGYVFVGWNTKADGTGRTTIKDKGTIGTLTAIDGKVMTLYAQWVSEDSTLNIKEDKYIIRNIDDTPNDIKKLNNYKNIEVFDNNSKISDTTKLKTGNKLTLGNNEYTIVVVGDVNNDGVITFADITRIYKYYKKIDTPSKENMYAADTTKDGNIEFSDITRLYKMLEGVDISEE